VSIYPRDEFSNLFPSEMPCRLAIALGNGRVLTKEVYDYPGFISQPMSWEMAFEKFERVATASTTSSARRSIADAVKNLDAINVRDLTGLLHDLGAPKKNVQKASSVRKES